MADAAKPLILYQNKLESPGIAAITSEASGYPKSNLYDGRPFTTWKPTTTATQNIDIDLGASATIEAFAVLQHTLGTNTATVTITSTTNADYTTGATTHKTINFTTDTNYWVRMDTTNFSRYCRIAITSQDAVVAIGEMFLGAVYQLRMPEIIGRSAAIWQDRPSFIPTGSSRCSLGSSQKHRRKHTKTFGRIMVHYSSHSYSCLMKQITRHGSTI
jgi:hypothetical protein